jgi:transcriptional regulator GlxA family with amidase domain
MTPPGVGLILQPGFSLFHVAVPHMVFNLAVDGQRLFRVSLVAESTTPVPAHHAMLAQPDGGLDSLDDMDIVVVSGWPDLNHRPSPELAQALVRAHRRGAHVVGLCYGSYALAYAGLLDGKRASTHWLAEHDFSRRFPKVHLDTNALYVHDEGLVTSAGTAAGLDCCLFLVRNYYGAQMANRVARIMVVAPHREGGQAQFIDQPVAVSTKDARINTLLDYLRGHLADQHTLDGLAQRIAMSRRTFTRHFQRATGTTLVKWLATERLQHSRELLE